MYCFNCFFHFSEEIDKSKFNSMIGLIDRERIDAELYDDFETAKAREVCVLFCKFIICGFGFTLVGKL